MNIHRDTLGSCWFAVGLLYAVPRCRQRLWPPPAPLRIRLWLPLRVKKWVYHGLRFVVKIFLTNAMRSPNILRVVIRWFIEQWHASKCSTIGTTCKSQNAIHDYILCNKTKCTNTVMPPRLRYSCYTNATCKMYKNSFILPLSFLSCSIYPIKNLSNSKRSWVNLFFLNNSQKDETDDSFHSSKLLDDSNSIEDICRVKSSQHKIKTIYFRNAILLFSSISLLIVFEHSFWISFILKVNLSFILSFSSLLHL